MLNRIKKWLGLPEILATIDDIKETIVYLKNRDDFVREKITEYDKLKKLDIDAGFRGQSTVVLTGIFQGRGYVQFYDIDHKEFEYLVRDFRERKKHGHVRNIDAPPQFYGAFDL